MNICKLKLVVSIFLCGILINSRLNCQSRQGSTTDQVVDPQQWVRSHFAKGKVPPFSFKYGGIDSKNFITGWKYAAEELPSDDPNIKKNVYSYQDKKSGLRVKCFVTSYTDFPAVEWILKFSNRADANTPVIEQAEVISYRFDYAHKGNLCSASFPGQQRPAQRLSAHG